MAASMKFLSEFPYYIVRFKQMTRKTHFEYFVQVSILHSTIQTNTETIAIATHTRFPYYIVRFKPRSPPLFVVVFVGFHTTQYDLNCLFIFFVFLVFLFPYYIVRFKRRRTNRYGIGYILFPYYIVRFKRTNYLRRGKFWGSFHTTQYDLNLRNIFNLSHLYHMFPYYIVRFKPFVRVRSLSYWDLFPYYIVRFKLAVTAHVGASLIGGFHTTQYDLNLFVLPLFVQLL